MSVGATKPRSDFSAEGLAEQISAHNAQHWDARAVGRTKAAVIHAFGQALSGASTAVPKALLTTHGVAMAGGPSLIFGTQRRTSAVDAALINATAAAAGSGVSSDAGSAAYIVSLFGLCEERRKTGQEFLDALMFGAGLSLAVASTVPASAPVAMTGQLTSALFGAVVAATRVIKLSRPKISSALLIAGVTNPGGPPASQVGPSSFMVGLSMRNGLLAALLAEAMDETFCIELAKSEEGASSSRTASSSTLAPMEGANDLLAIQSPPGTDLWDQFEQQASAVLPRDHIAPLFERLETIDKVTDLAMVSRLLQGRSAQAAPKKIVFASRGTHEPEETNWVP
ncbi:hypothetical protein ABIB73_003708 [Bradyrhizobium sp. F1.4.3]|uniref:MmgE/PrpD family protein n=1 Tax=Bradyrhizobium sp. F1.4.3 TaxID=3156356 RepID=UPI00339A1217